jgi:hypothetical protein
MNRQRLPEPLDEISDAVNRDMGIDCRMRLIAKLYQPTRTATYLVSVATAGQLREELRKKR